MAPTSRFYHCLRRKQLIAIISISIFVLLSALSFIGSKHQDVLLSSPNTKRTIFGHMKRHFYIYCVEVNHIYRSLISYPTILIAKIAHCIRYITRHILYEFRYLLYLINIPFRILRFLIKPIKYIAYLHDSRALSKAIASHKHWSSAIECASRKTDVFFSIPIRFVRVVFYIIDDIIDWTDSHVHAKYVPNGSPIINYSSSIKIVIDTEKLNNLENNNHQYPEQTLDQNETTIPEEIITEQIEPDVGDSKPARNLIRETDYNIINEIYQMIISKLKLLVKASETNLAC